MMPVTNITTSGQSGSAAYLYQPAVINGGLPGPNPAQFPMVWCATARDYEYTPGSGAGSVGNSATRTAQTCYMRGLKENIEIQISDGLPWQWRRICFTYRNLTTILPNSVVAGSAFQGRAKFTSGYARVMNLIPTSALVDAFEAILFKGAKDQDWKDPMIAPVDTLRVDVKSDRTITIASGNEDGVIRKYSRWYPMNKNLVYADDEFGGGFNASEYSVSDKRGMGDYYICDYFAPRAGSSTSNQLRVSMNSTLYWHEK